MRCRLFLLYLSFFFFFFFFSSRRRHTRSVSAFLLNRSSDLRLLRLKRFSTFSVKVLNLFSRSRRKTNKRKSKHSRSEERRVGKECRSRGAPAYSKKAIAIRDKASG